MTIPEMTNPLGRSWEQPKDIRDAPMDEKTVLLTPAQFAGLLNYDSSLPTGVYPGKCWKRHQIDPVEQTTEDFLVWYGDDVNGKCSVNWRKIEVIK